MAQQKGALTVTDIMKLRQIHHTVISEDGRWVAYTASPDRGDGEVKVHSTKDKKIYTIDRGSNPIFSRNGHWVAAAFLPKSAEIEKAKKDKPKKGMILLNTENGEPVEIEKVEQFTFSMDSKWLAFKHFKKSEEKDSGDKEKNGSNEKSVGTDFVLLNLETGEETKLSFLSSFAFDSTSQFCAYSISDTSGEHNGLYAIKLLESGQSTETIEATENGHYTNLTWNNKNHLLAYISAILDDKNRPDSASLKIWNPSQNRIVNAVPDDGLAENWTLPTKNRMIWTKDGQRLFFGLKPGEDEQGKDEEEKEEIDLYDKEAILAKKEVDVWHWNDPFINTHQKNLWPREKDRTYQTVYHLATDRYVRLADREMSEVNISQNPMYALGSSDRPYRKLRTWDGGYDDYYWVDLENGSRDKIISKLGGRASLSPGANFVIYYADKHWHLYDRKKNAAFNLTEKLDTPFCDEDHDSPSAVPGYGVGGWIAQDKAVLIYDKYDIWQFPTNLSNPINLTAGKGRQQQLTFRIRRLDPERPFFTNGEKLLLTTYHNREKFTAFYTCQVGNPGVIKLLEEAKKFRFIAKAKNDKSILYTRESYTEFPDIWISDMAFRKPKKLSHVNPKIEDFAWGKAELVEWNSLDGVPLQGVLIKPGNYEKGKQYPVLVYFYRFFSQRLHEFNQTVINHRPCFPFYASNGYAVFLPDIRFEIGHPGFSATKCLVPGVQKLIDMGIADPEAVALHGHSWSGYQAAFIITQTDIFACAIAGAPVSNMTSAYSGIRWGSGLARQFQYEQTQSRIGGSLWEYPERYIENSPVFFVDQINTPLLIMFGDEDGAVPWYQGIELYLAMRRFEKDCIFLQYRGEPHHLQKYPNKLDYTLKMKAYLDHYCKGEPASKWITEGVPYRGK